MAALPPKADIDPQPANVRFVPKADIAIYSITSSVIARREGGNVSPSIRAVD